MKDSPVPVERTPGEGAPIGVVLAGGRGDRIGGDKASIELAGQPLISYPLGAIAEAAIEPIVVAKTDSSLPPVSCEVIHEPDAPRHPLCGIVTVLRQAGDRPLIVLGCDMPFVDPALLAMLASASEPLVVPSFDGCLQPFPGRYDISLLPDLEAALSAQRGMRPTIEALGPRRIAEEEVAGLDLERICFNVNTETDLGRAERMLKTTAR